MGTKGKQWDHPSISKLDRIEHEISHLTKFLTHFL